MADDLDSLVIDLGNAAEAINDKVRPVVSKGALNIKNQLRTEAKNSDYFRLAPWINYDLTDHAGDITAEIGPRKEHAGALANIAYFGGAHGGGASVPDPQGALDAEADRFVSALEALAGIL